MAAAAQAQSRKEVIITSATDAAAQSGVSAVEGQPAEVEKEPLEINMGRSRAIHTPYVVSRVAVANPDIADVQVLEPDQLLVVAKSAGTTDLIVWSNEGKIWQTPVRVAVDVGQVNKDLAKLFPGASLGVSSSLDVYFVHGDMESAAQVEQLRKFLEVSGIRHVDMTRLAGIQQVSIRVRVAEVNRTAIKKLGVNAFAFGSEAFGGLTLGPESGGAINPVDFSKDVIQVNPFVTLFGGFPGAELDAFVQALAENQYLRILAEPNLVALSGEEADFLAGGEFPIPVVQGGTIGGGASVTIEYKDFGIKLKFRPTVLGDGKIRLHVAPEVSDLSDLGGLEIQGFKIPSILTRRTETTVEMNSGQTFVMAGLYKSSENSRNSRVPGLGDLPVVGTPFRNMNHQTQETELVILVKADLVEPLSHKTARPLPGEQHVKPNTWELFFEGRLEGRAGGEDKAQCEGKCVPECVKNLKGPGPWASYR